MQQGHWVWYKKKNLHREQPEYIFQYGLARYVSQFNSTKEGIAMYIHSLFENGVNWAQALESLDEATIVMPSRPTPLANNDQIAHLKLPNGCRGVEEQAQHHHQKETKYET